MTDRAKHRNIRKVRSRRVLGGGVAAVVAVTVVGVTGLGGGLLGRDTGTAQVSAAVGGDPAVASDVVPESQPTVDVKAAVETAQDRASEPMPDLSKMSLTQLQTYAAKTQTQFVQASLAYQQAKTQADQAQEAAEQAQERSEAAQRVETRTRGKLVNYVVATYSDGALSNPGLQLLAAGPSSSDEVLGRMTLAREVADQQAAEFERWRAASDRSDALAERASALEDEAVSAEADAQVLFDDIQGRAAKVAAAANKALANSADGLTLFTSAEQEARNKAALRDWQAYLTSLDRAGVVPPPAADLTNPARLPQGLKPLVGPGGAPLPGVASKVYRGTTVTVLPKETLAAVSRAFSAVGKPFVTGEHGPDTYDCSGLVAGVFAPSGVRVTATSPVAQYQHNRLVPVKTAQVGDVVFFKNADGVQHVGINLGGRLMLTADASAQQVGVQQFPGKPYAAARVTLPHGGVNKAPETRDDSPTRCNADPSLLTGNAMAYPLREGTYTLGVGFGVAGPLWSSGFHTGQDFPAPTGTPVMAAKAGTVTVSSSSWGGPNFVTIDHGNGLQSAYAHMSKVFVATGDVVQAGDLIGAVGEEGNATGPHLHFEVLVGGVKVDPMLFLTSSDSGNIAWGGFSNGMIPASELCPLAGRPGHRLRCDAAAAFNSMATAYQKALKAPLCITDSYRSYAAQVTLYGQKPNLAAVPGTSNHGWALAVDLCGGIESWGSKQRDWMVANAPRFGWYSPGWAQPGNGREEPWHWEFGHIS